MNKSIGRRERRSTVSIESVLSNEVPGRAKFFPVGDSSINLLNFLVWKQKGTTCIYCGRKGEFFADERTRPVPGQHLSPYNQWHLNLYAKDEFGRDILMTKDHTLAKSHGGEDDISNLEPMCDPCNHNKSKIECKALGRENFDPSNIKSVLQINRTRRDTLHIDVLNKFDHIKMRLAERMNFLDLTMDEYGDLCDQVRSDKTMIMAHTNKLSIHIVVLRGMDLHIAVLRRRIPISVLPPKSMEEHLEEVPLWAANNNCAREAKEMYNKIKDELMEYYEARPHKDTECGDPDNQKEIAMYFKKYRYQESAKALFVLWKGRSHNRKKLDFVCGHEHTTSYAFYVYVWNLVRKMYLSKNIIKKGEEVVEWNF